MDPPSKLKRGAKTAAVALAIFAGCGQAIIGVGSFFSLRPNGYVIFLFEIVGLLPLFALVPLGLLAIRRPRLASYTMLLSAGISLIYMFVPNVPGGALDRQEFFLEALCILVPPCVSASLLRYASSQG